MKEDIYQTVSGFYFDTYNTITARCEKELLHETMKLCRKYHDQFSRFEPCSDIWKLNHADGRFIELKEDTVDLLQTAKQIYLDSDGAFNPAMGKLSSLWKASASAGCLPDSKKIEAILPDTDYSRLQIDGTFVRIPRGMSIDLGGIAKGYIEDKAAELLREHDASSALLNFGGNIVCFGKNKNDQSWRIGLQMPFGEYNEEFWAYLTYEEAAISTSGVYERGFDLNGRRYHHILHPRTGYPVDNHIITVTVIAETAILADALSTAALVLGPEKGSELVHRYGGKTVYLLKEKTYKAVFSPDTSIVIPR